MKKSCKPSVRIANPKSLRTHSFLRYPAGIFFSLFLWLTLASGIRTVSAAPPILLPAINTNFIVNVTNYGAIGDGIFTNTTAIQNAIKAAALGATTNGLSGGTVRIPAGVFLCGPLTLSNFINLRLDAGAILQALPLASYPGGTTSPTDFIVGNGRHDISITGTGTIDGQGSPWWRALEADDGIDRPLLLSLQPASQILITGVTFSNAPAQNIAIKGKGGNVTFDGVIFRAPSSGDATNPSHNTDALDLAETNVVIRNCDISVGDDNLALGSSSGPSADILVTNCACGYGHGISIGSFTSGGVSNLTVVDCSFINTDQGIRIKSDRDRGGIVQNLAYYNLTMSNVQYPILIYGYYTNTLYGSINNLTPAIAATIASNAVTSKTPIYRNILISNVTATAQSGRMVGLIWGLPEMPITNLVLSKVTLSGSKTLGIYYAKGVQLIDSPVTVPNNVNTLSFYSAQITVSNSAPLTNLVKLSGASSNSLANTLSFFNAKASLIATNALASSPGITLGGSTLTISNNWSLTPSSVLNFALTTNASTFAVTSNLLFTGTMNISAGPGFTNGSYTLFTYGKTLLTQLPTVGTTPPGYTYDFDYSTTGQVKLMVTPFAPDSPTNFFATPSGARANLTWSPVATATAYNVKRSTTNNGSYSLVAIAPTTNYSDISVSNGVTYYYVVSATNSGGESANSLQLAIMPKPLTNSPSLMMTNYGSLLRFTWPSDHVGWTLQTQMNIDNSSLGTNWVNVPNSQFTNQFFLHTDASNRSVFLRLVYP